jgi:hypothetical protein
VPGHSALLEQGDDPFGDAFVRSHVHVFLLWYVVLEGTL